MTCNSRSGQSRAVRELADGPPTESRVAAELGHLGLSGGHRGAGIAGLGRRRLGVAGEDLAVGWYTDRGYRLLARNWRTRSGEIDLVVERGGEIIFCEVKTRSSDRFGSPVEAVGPTKQARLRRLAGEWLRFEAVSPRRGVRFDVASVLAGRIEVIEEAF